MLGAALQQPARKIVGAVMQSMSCEVIVTASSTQSYTANNDFWLVPIAVLAGW
jgi:hypothetical protein